MKVQFLEGMINSFKECMDIKERSGIYNVSPTKLEIDRAYLKGLEDTYNIFEGENYGK